jgi:hypothetical protein
MKLRAKGCLSWSKWAALFTVPAQNQRWMSGGRMISVGALREVAPAEVT